MRAIHTWIAVMTLLCFVAFGLLVLTSSCATREREPLTDPDTEQPAVESESDIDRDAETGTQADTANEVTGDKTESDSDGRTETGTEKTTETETEKPKPRNGLRYLSNEDGTYTVAGIGSYKDACLVIPETYNDQPVTAIAASAFYGCDTIVAVQIPATVKKIGDLAFAGCANLTNISVSRENRYYCDKGGVLYTADESTLILYPPSHGGEAVTVGVRVKYVGAMAFYGCKYLKVVYYEGTAAEWERVNIASGNYSLFTASVSTKQIPKKNEK